VTTKTMVELCVSNPVSNGLQLPTRCHEQHPHEAHASFEPSARSRRLHARRENRFNRFAHRARTSRVGETPPARTLVAATAARPTRSHRSAPITSMHSREQQTCRARQSSWTRPDSQGGADLAVVREVRANRSASRGVRINAGSPSCRVRAELDGVLREPDGEVNLLPQGNGAAQTHRRYAWVCHRVAA
jgi:hypothetical protein